MNNPSKHINISKQSTLASRLQRIATSVLVMGFAGTIATHRIAHSFDNASKGLRVSDPSPRNFVPVNNVSHRERANSAAARMLHNQQLLNELVQQLRNTHADAGNVRADAIKRAREIARSLHVFDRISNVPTRQIADGVIFNMCASPEESAVTFLSTSSTYAGAGGGALTISLTGNQGEHQFTFASGTTQANIINAINSFTKQTGVEAIQSIENNQRVQMNSVDVGSESLVHVHEVNGPGSLDYIFEQAIGGIALKDLKDYGKNAITLQAIKDNP